MNQEDRPRFASLLTALASSFGKEADEAMAEGYWLGLDDLSVGELEDACRRALRESEFMPKPVELRHLAGHMPAGSRAVLAWEAVMRAMTSRGSWASVDFDDPIVNATLRNMGGWLLLCGKTTEELQTWSRKEFERIYSALCESGVSAEACAYLPGAHETQAIAGGYVPTPAVPIACQLPEHKSNVIRKLASGETLRLVSSITDKVGKR